MAAPYRFSVFTKPWKTEIRELGAFVKRLGFTGIELPVRPGYPVHPENVTAELPNGSARLEVAVAPIPVALPSFTSFDFVAVP